MDMGQLLKRHLKHGSMHFLPLALRIIIFDIFALDGMHRNHNFENRKFLDKKVTCSFGPFFKNFFFAFPFSPFLIFLPCH